jgi:hypothetical protein
MPQVGGRRHRHFYVECLQLGRARSALSDRLAMLLSPLPAAAATRVGGFSFPELTLWLPGASLTVLLLSGSVAGVRIQSGATGGPKLPRGNRGRLSLNCQRGIEVVKGRAMPEAAMIEQGRGRWPPFPAISSHFETGQVRLVADLSGEWSRFGSWWHGLARSYARGRSPAVPPPRASGAFRPCFLCRFASAVPERALPTLKTGSGESRSRVRIPPHPLFGMA